MRALTLQGSMFRMEEMEDPVPAKGQLLVAPLFNGICGSDLHQRHSMKEEEEQSEGDRSDLQKIILGHEFCSEVVAVGPGTETPIKVGDRVVALPFTPGSDPHEMINIGLDPARSGGLGTLSLVDAVRAFRVPDEVPSKLAALTEPLAVGLHAANLADRNDGPNIILGCGPIGLAVLLALKEQGRGPIIAVDFSDRRREMAGELGADVLVNPKEDSPYRDWSDIGFSPEVASPLLPRDFKGRPSGLNIFECTGSGGVLKQITEEAPPHSHVIYAGVCMHSVGHVPMQATLRELTIEYSFAYTPVEFEQALDMIAGNPETVAKLVTSCVPLSETEQAMDKLADTPSEIKILVDVRA